MSTYTLTHAPTTRISSTSTHTPTHTCSLHVIRHDDSLPLSNAGAEGHSPSHGVCTDSVQGCRQHDPTDPTTTTLRSKVHGSTNNNYIPVMTQSVRGLADDVVREFDRPESPTVISRQAATKLTKVRTTKNLKKLPGMVKPSTLIQTGRRTTVSRQ